MLHAANTLLLRHRGARSWANHNTRTSVALDGLPRRRGESMHLHGQSLRRELAATHDLVERDLGALGERLLLEERLDRHGRALGRRVKDVELDWVVNDAFVARAERASAQLRDAAVKRLLTTLKTRPRRSTSARLLAAHTEATGGALSRRDAASLPLLLLLRPRCRPQVVLRKDDRVDGGKRRLVRLTPLPIEELHVERGRRAGVAHHAGVQTVADETIHAGHQRHEAEQ
mmetsp:Transcript_20922/g.37682  ORF Transcript_20922/g.37682 Transcript_20922/m.37682 type:complete len:230 (+) Transcript_20922:303-992(+)